MFAITMCNFFYTDLLDVYDTCLHKFRILISILFLNVLEILKLGWNMIRLSSAVDLGSSLSINDTLIYLGTDDVHSYDCLSFTCNKMVFRDYKIGVCFTYLH
jgi:hypothetical protein